MSGRFSATKLMEAPIERAAFSDRMAYVCAELSSAAYFPFEGGAKKYEVMELLQKKLRSEHFSQVSAILNSAMPLNASPSSARKEFEKELKPGNFKLEEVFSEDGCEAFLATRDIKTVSANTKRLAFLVFRGSEKSIDDWRRNAKAKLVPPTDENGEVIEKHKNLRFHAGYLDFYQTLEKDIIKKLDDIKYDQLFITGHSLGGAVAVVATRLLPYEIRGACYTYGAPPVGHKSIQHGLKTPCYQIINENDLVPNLPNPWIALALRLLLSLVKALSNFFLFLKPFFEGTLDEKAHAFLTTQIGFEHPGYVSYLIGEGRNVRLRLSLRFFSKLTVLSKTLWNGSWFSSSKKMIDDHAIGVYVEKLKRHGLSRN